MVGKSQASVVVDIPTSRVVQRESAAKLAVVGATSATGRGAAARR
jgi:hypothetical protein